MGIEKIHTLRLTDRELGAAAELLKAGHCVAFPTETVYGLGANALDSQAVEGIFAAKGRPSDNPLIVHLCSVCQLEMVAAAVPKAAWKLIEQYWPGPLSLVLPRQAGIGDGVTAGLDTVAVRIPSHPTAQELLRLTALPVAAPSANRSGRPSPTRAEHVLQDLDGRIAAVIDGGATAGLESTVVNCTTEPFRLLRPGSITLEQLNRHAAVEPSETALDPEQTPPSPGMKYRHYAPEAEMILVEGAAAVEKMLALAAAAQARGERVVLLTLSEDVDRAAAAGFAALDMGSRSRLDQVAARMYHLLRKADAMQADRIIVQGVEASGVGQAIMDRFGKAAAARVRSG